MAESASARLAFAGRGLEGGPGGGVRVERPGEVGAGHGRRELGAERKKWPLENVRVRLEHDRIHAADCDTKEGMIDRMTRRLELDGDELTGEQVERLVEIANRCPVHRTLSSEIHIRTMLHRDVGRPGAATGDEGEER